MRGCGGCEGSGRHRRWCPEVVGISASEFGKMAEQAESIGDRIGANDVAAANTAYGLAGYLMEEARLKAETYMQQHGTHH